jgi:hypothetical protein
MTFTKSFKYDIFISYSHLDNAAPEGKLGWIDDFHAELESGLVKKFGYNIIKIWRDKDLSGNTLFDNRIKEVINNSALFLALTSSNYLKSDYCRKELDWFYKQAEESRCGLSVNNECRLLNILLNNIPHTLWPEEFSGSGGFKIHDAPERSDDSGEPIDHSDPQFRKKLRKIIDAIETTLNKFPRTGIEDKAIKEKEEEFRIYIADVTDTLQSVRDRLVADLKTEDVEVLTDIPPPYENKAHEESVTDAINKARLSIHLLDELPGRRIMDLKTTTYPRRQVEIGLHSGTQQIIWVPKELEIKDIEENYANFLKSHENLVREEGKYEFMRESKTYITDLILQKIDQIRQEQESGDDTDSAPVLLDTHQKDQRFAWDLAAYLSKKDINVEVCKESKDPRTNLQNFVKYLKHANSLVIIFGNVTPSWVHQRLTRTIKEIYIQPQPTGLNKNTLENRWILLLPTSKITHEIDNLAKDFGIEFIDHRHSSEIDEKVVKTLLNCVKKGGGDESE